MHYSSMGITAPHDFLNSLGKDKEGKGHGDVLIWKRKAEEYLVQVRFGAFVSPLKFDNTHKFINKTLK